jgi:hypothetical protein
MGKALAGGSGWVLLTWSPRDRKLGNQWASDHCHTVAGATPILALDGAWMAKGTTMVITWTATTCGIGKGVTSLAWTGRVEPPGAA